MSFAFADNLDVKLEKDSNNIINKILKDPDAKGMVSALKKGPPPQLGFMWGLNEPNYWTVAERKGIDKMHIWVLMNGWESSGYAIMFRTLQSKIENIDDINAILHREG